MAQCKTPFKRHRFPCEIILLAVRWYCRYPLSCRDVRDMLAERGVGRCLGDPPVGQEVRSRDPRTSLRCHRSWRGLQWHVDETYIRVGGRWCYLRRAQEAVCLYHPLTIVADKEPSYAKVIGEINARLEPEDAIQHVDRKYLNNRIESEHAASKQRLCPMRRFWTMAGSKAALAGIETFRTIRKDQFENCETGVANEIDFVANPFAEAA